MGIIGPGGAGTSDFGPGSFSAGRRVHAVEGMTHNPRFPMSALRSLALVSLLTAPAAAQRLDASITFDPTVTSTTLRFMATGTPGSACVLLVAPLRAPGYPTPFGPLWLDPTGILTLAAFALPLSGTGGVSYTLPSVAIADLQLNAQGLLATGASAALTNVVALAHHVGLTDTPHACGIQYDNATNTVRVLGYASANDQIDVKVECPPPAPPMTIGTHHQQADGQYDRTFPCNLDPGCKVVVYFNNVVYFETSR